MNRNKVKKSGTKYIVGQPLLSESFDGPEDALIRKEWEAEEHPIPKTLEECDRMEDVLTMFFNGGK